MPVDKIEPYTGIYARDGEIDMEQVTSICLEWAKVGADLLKAYAWPIAVFAIVYLFRKQIRALLPLTRKAGPGGLEFEPLPQPTDRKQDEGLQTVPPPHAMKTVNVLVGAIKEDLKKIDEKSRETALVASLAQARVEAAFEFIFGVIFQSQINALRELLSKSITLTEARKMYETIVVPSNPSLYTTIDFDHWSKFLIGQGLVKVEGDTFHITDAGRDFLLFVDTKKAGMWRPT